jgi:hypothetical protein
MKSRAFAVACSAMIVLSGCSSSDSDDVKADKVPAGYCTDLKKSIKDVLGPDGSEKLQDIVVEYGTLAAAGPDKVGNHWRTIEVAYQELLDAFDKAKVDINDPEAAKKAVDDKRIPKKVVEATESDKVRDAVQAIAEHSVSTCGFDLTGKKATPTPKRTRPTPSGATPK